DRKLRHDVAGHLVVRAEPRNLLTVHRIERTALTGPEQCLGHHGPEAPWPSDPRGNVHALQHRMVPDVLGGVADRLHPGGLAGVLVDGGDAAVRRFYDRQAERRGRRLCVSACAAASPAGGRFRASATRRVIPSSTSTAATSPTAAFRTASF